MQQVLMNKLFEYIRENNPDLLLELQDEERVTVYLSDKVKSILHIVEQLNQEGKPDYIIEENCMDILTKDLLPSRFNYICSILQEEFEKDYKQFIETGLLQFEAINMLKHCQPVFEDLKFSEENEDNQFLRHAVTGGIAEYLKTKEANENMSNELQQSKETGG